MESAGSKLERLDLQGLVPGGNPGLVTRLLSDTRQDCCPLCTEKLSPQRGSVLSKLTAGDRRTQAFSALPLPPRQPRGLHLDVYPVGSSPPPHLIDKGLCWPSSKRRRDPDRCVSSGSPAEPVSWACPPLPGGGYFCRVVFAQRQGIFAKGQPGGVPWLPAGNSSRMCR